MLLLERFTIKGPVLYKPYFDQLGQAYKSGLKQVCNINNVYGNHKTKNSQDYAQKPQRNCMLMNSAS